MSSKTLLAVALLAAIPFTAVPLAANAADTADFGVQLVVENACNISAGGTASDLDFLTVTGNIAADIDASTNLTVNCNNGALYTIGLDDGDNFSGGRRMTNGTQFVDYVLYRDGSRTQAWGALGSGNELSGTGTNADQLVPVYGRVPSGQSVGAGTYNDIVTATIAY